MQIIVAAAVAVVLMVGARVIYYAATSGDDGGKDEASSSGSTGGEGKGGKDGELAGGSEKVPANTKSKVAFQVPQPVVKDIVTVEGSWLTDKAYVKTGINEINGYDRDKGTKLWSFPLPRRDLHHVPAREQGLQDGHRLPGVEADQGEEVPRVQPGRRDRPGRREAPVEQERHLRHRR
ncbi:hypothetical protein SBADM41S_01091 [Streptomyces badius]